MKSVGQLLKQARLDRKLRLSDLSAQIKIRSEYIQAIEADRFDLLPSATFVKGFIQSYAKAVGIKPDHALAVFRRDFDQNQQGKIIPRGVAQPLHTPSRFWRPQTTTFVFALILILFIGAYLAYQFRSYTQAPRITLFSPSDQSVLTSFVEVRGQTTPDATITVNSQPVTTDQSGKFQTTLNLSPGDHTLIIVSTDRKGRTRTLSRTVTVAPNP